MNYKKAFVTGANGFVGSHLVKYLADHEIDTIAFILKGTDYFLLKELNPSLKFVKIIEGDVLDKKSFEQYIQGMHYVFHLAGVLQGYTQEDYDRINVKGTQNILEVCSKSNPKLERLVISSSSAAAGTGTLEDPLKEEKEAQPLHRDYYGISKHRMESLTKSYKDDLPITIVRPSSVLGPGNRLTLNMHKSVKYRFRLKLGGPYRPISVIDVRDLVKGIYLCAVNPKAIGETFYFANDEPVSYNELHDLVSQSVYNRKKGKLISILIPNFMFWLFAWLAEVIYKIRRKPAPFVNRSKVLAFLAEGQVISSEKAKTILGWQTTVELSSSIAEEGQWYIDQGLV